MLVDSTSGIVHTFCVILCLILHSKGNYYFYTRHNRRVLRGKRSPALSRRRPRSHAAEAPPRHPRATRPFLHAEPRRTTPRADLCQATMRSERWQRRAGVLGCAKDRAGIRKVPICAV